MAEWYVKDFSKLTNVSVRTLHHYDHIDLLKPSIRLPNGYRLYSEGDLLKLQLILALKSFGFDLSQIKKLMKQGVNPLDHLRAQKKFLQEQVLHLQNANKVLDLVISKLENKFIRSEDIVKLIEEYSMHEELYYNIDSQKQKPNNAKHNKEEFTGVEQIYFEHPEFRKFYDSYHLKLAKFLAEAMKNFTRE